jgi:hypothetical protein
MESTTTTTAAAAGGSNVLTFYPPSCSIDPGFWEELYNRKVNVYKLDDSAVQITAVFGSDGNLSLGAESFALAEKVVLEEQQSQHVPFSAKGTLLNFNTIEAFKELNKKAYLQREAAVLYRQMVDLVETKDGPICAAVRRPELLNSFAVIVFSDLKSYKFTYWFGMPTFVASTVVVTTRPCLLKEFSEGSKLLAGLYSGISVSAGFDHFSRGAFALRRNISDRAIWETASLEDIWAQRCDTSNVIIVFVDNSVGDNDPYKHSWGLRNLLALLDFHCTEPSSVKIISLRSPALRKCIDMVQSFVANTSAALSRAVDQLAKVADTELGRTVNY